MFKAMMIPIFLGGRARDRRGILGFAISSGGGGSGSKGGGEAAQRQCSGCNAMIDEYAIGWRRRQFEASGGFLQKGSLVALAALICLNSIH